MHLVLFQTHASKNVALNRWIRNRRVFSGLQVRTPQVDEQLSLKPNESGGRYEDLAIFLDIRNCDFVGSLGIASGEDSPSRFVVGLCFPSTALHDPFAQKLILKHSVRFRK